MGLMASMTAVAGHSVLLVGADAVMRGLGYKGSSQTGCEEKRYSPDLAMGGGDSVMKRLFGFLAAAVAIATVGVLIVGGTLSMAFLSGRTLVFSNRRGEDR